MVRTSRGEGGVWTTLDESHEMRRNGEKLSWDLKMARSHEKVDFFKIQCKNFVLLVFLVCKSHEMGRTSRGGGGVWTTLDESHEMRRNGEKLSWDLKMARSYEKVDLFKIHCRNNVY